MTDTHPRERFDMYARPLELGDWSYVLDEFGDDVAYGKHPLWPFGRNHVRVSPDCDYRSWRNEYVLVGVDGPDATTAEAALTLLVREQGMGGAVVHVPVALDLAASTVTIVHFDDLSDRLREEALVKGRRLLDLIARERGRRDAGQLRPVAAYDLAGDS